MKNTQKSDLEQLLSPEELYRIKKKRHFEAASHKQPEFRAEPPKESDFLEKPAIKSANQAPAPEFQPQGYFGEFAFEPAKVEPRKTSSLMNLISKSKNKSNHEEIDLFEEETHGVSAETYYKNVELENYWVFLKNNIGNKNIMVIPIEDDEEKEKEDPGLWRFSLKELGKWNRKGVFREKAQFNKSKRQENGDLPNSQELEGNFIDRAKWVNCQEMQRKPGGSAAKPGGRAPRLINLS